MPNSPTGKFHMQIQENYLRMTINANLRWKEHVKEKREKLAINFKKTLVATWKAL